MKDRAGQHLRRICGWLLQRSIGLYPAEKQSWGEAALAELQATPTAFSSLRWTLGGMWVAIRSYFSHGFWHPADLFLGRSSLLRLSWRSLSPLLLLLSLGFFLIPQFRQAFDTTTSLWAAGSIRPALSDHEERAWQARAEREHDAQTLAFLALRMGNPKSAIALAEEAVLLDPSLTWILSTVARNDFNSPLQAPSDWPERLQRWEPDNAFLRLQQAQSISRPIALAAKKLSPEMLTGNQQFRSFMAQAFAAPNYDSYLARRYELDRGVLKKHGMEKPLLLMVGMDSHPVPNLYGIRAYAEWLVTDARAAMQGGRTEAAENEYWQVVHFGQNMESHSYTPFERLIGSTLQQIGGRELLPLLRAQGKGEIAATLAYALDHFKRLDRRDAVVRASLIDPKIYPWTENFFGVAHMVVYLDKSDFIVHGAAFIFVVSLGLSAMCLVYLRFHGAQGIAGIQLPRLITYAPPLVFASALALLVSYLPYARIFQMYMADSSLVRPRLGPVTDFDPLWAFAKLEIVESWGRARAWPVILALALGVMLLGLYNLVRMGSRLKIDNRVIG